MDSPPREQDGPGGDGRQPKLKILVISVAAVLALGALGVAWRAVRPPTVDVGQSVSRANTAWPDATNTGPPPGTDLRSYEGDCTITTAGLIIDGRKLDCDVVVRGQGVVIARSEIHGRLIVEETGSVRVSESLIDGGQQDNFPTVGQQHLVLQRVNVVGGQHSVQCQVDCVIEDSWLHDQAPPSDGSHMNAFISNGGHGFSLRHNTIACTSTPNPAGGGCTADASLFGDFAPIADVVFDRNLFKANAQGLGYCLQAGSNPTKQHPDATRVVFTQNVFERGPGGKCGLYGAITAFDGTQPGNQWDRNVWDDGSPVVP